MMKQSYSKSDLEWAFSKLAEECEDLAEENRRLCVQFDTLREHVRMLNWKKQRLVADFEERTADRRFFKLTKKYPKSDIVSMLEEECRRLTRANERLLRKLNPETDGFAFIGSASDG